LDRILIPALPLEARVGVTAEERAEPQVLSLDIELGLDLARAGADDELGATIDYVAVCETVVVVAADREFRLIEAVAERVATALLEGFPVAEVTVRVSKPSALRAFGAPYAAVEVRRLRDA